MLFNWITILLLHTWKQIKLMRKEIVRSNLWIRSCDQTPEVIALYLRQEAFSNYTSKIAVFPFLFLLEVIPHLNLLNEVKVWDLEKEERVQLVYVLQSKFYKRACSEFLEVSRLYTEVNRWVRDLLITREEMEDLLGSQSFQGGQSIKGGL